MADQPMSVVPQESSPADPAHKRPRCGDVCATAPVPAATPAPLDVHCERTALFFGDKFPLIRRAYVVVVGVGGVGSMAATALVRTGIRKLRIVDFDIVTLSSLNRNAVATRNDVGKAKTECLKEHFAAICPEVEVEAVHAFFREDQAEQLLLQSGTPDLVVDCIDNVPNKVALLHYCHSHSVPVISSFGVGACIDPSKIRSADIKDTFACPLGRVIRKKLGKLGVKTGITCVFSTETDRRPLKELTDDEYERLKQSGGSEVRTRAIPSFMALPAIAGLTLADVALCVIAGLPHVFSGDDGGSAACPAGTQQLSKADAKAADPATSNKCKKVLAER
eukprot:m51a1_g4413 hypothetical protein (335) ;mRNA; f:450296-451622